MGVLVFVLVVLVVLGGGSDAGGVVDGDVDSDVEVDDKFKDDAHPGPSLEDQPVGAISPGDEKKYVDHVVMCQIFDLMKTLAASVELASRTRSRTASRSR